MSQVDDILNNLSEDEIALYSAGDTPEEEHIVVGDDRVITVPDSLKRIAVQWDHDIETVTFDCPRYWDGHDLSTMIIYINYLCPSGYLGTALVENVRVDEANTDLIHFEWTISDAYGSNRHHWNSELNREMYVSEGLELPPDFVETHPDILTQILLFNNNIIELQKTTMQRSAVYVGSGAMPDGYDVQIDPNGGDISTTIQDANGVAF